MSTWTVNGVALDDLEAESLRLILQNQEDDSVDVRFPTNFDGQLPPMFDPGSQCVVACDGVVALRGEVDDQTVQASDSSQSRSVRIYGPWHWFKTTPWLYSYPYIAGSQATTHGVIGGAVNALVTQILQSQAGLIQVGTVDLGDVTIPTTDAYDQTVAQVLQSILRMIPGAVVLFDYATAPPTCHVLGPSSATLQTVSLNAADGRRVTDLNYTARHSLQVGYVQLFYEVARSIRAGEFTPWQEGQGTSVNTTGSPTGQQGFHIIGTDAAGDPASRRAFRRTIRVSGQLDTTTYSFVCRLHDLAFWYLVNGYNPWHPTPYGWEGQLWRAFFRVFSAQAGLSLPGTKRTGITADASGIDGYRAVYAYGTAYPGIEPNAATVLNPSPAIRIGSIPQVFFDTPGITAVNVSLQWLGDPLITASNVCFVNPSGFNGTTYSKSVTTGTPETPLSGIAAKILAANSALFYDGSCTVYLEDAPATFWGVSRRLSMAPMNFQTPIQQVTYDTATGLASLSFGPPNQLGPQDLISLLRAGLA